MQRLGTIKQLQIQREPLKIGEQPNRVYTTDPILVVEQLRLTPAGALGLTGDSEEIIDAHNADHPRTRHKKANGLSFNFTGHYNTMRSKFGEHLLDGYAGENILIDNDQIIKLEGQRIAIKHENTLIYLDDVIPAPPCAEFSCYISQETISGERMKQTLQFLDDGMRGFYATLSTEPSRTVISTGDEVYLV